MLKNPQLPSDDQHSAGLLPSLPVFGQTRLARRAALAMFDAIDLEIALQACDAVETISKGGEDASYDHLTANAIVGIRRTSSNEAALKALHHAVDAIKAAKASSLSLETASVTSSVQKCLDAVYDDPRISRLQVAIIVRSDIDQIRFACEEVSIGKHAGLTGHVIGRIVPCHAIQIFDPCKSIEDEYR